MASHAVFEGLIVDEYDAPVDVSHVGGEAFYVVDEDGFRRHIESESVDRQVFEYLARAMEGHEDAVSQGTMKLLGQEDIFTKAAIEASLNRMDEQFELLLQVGLPEQARMSMGMMGFRVVIDMHGNLVEVRQPSAPQEPEDDSW